MGQNPRFLNSFALTSTRTVSSWFILDEIPLPPSEAGDGEMLGEGGEILVGEGAETLVPEGGSVLVGEIQVAGEGSEVLEAEGSEALATE